MSGCLGEEGQLAGITRSNEETWVWDDEYIQSLFFFLIFFKFSLLTVVIISQVCTYVKTNQTAHFKYDSLLSVNYTSIKLLF